MDTFDLNFIVDVDKHERLMSILLRGLARGNWLLKVGQPAVRIAVENVMPWKLRYPRHSGQGSVLLQKIVVERSESAAIACNLVGAFIALSEQPPMVYEATGRLFLAINDTYFWGVGKSRPLDEVDRTCVSDDAVDTLKIGVWYPVRFGAPVGWQADGVLQIAGDEGTDGRKKVVARFVSSVVPIPMCDTLILERHKTNVGNISALQIMDPKLASEL